MSDGIQCPFCPTWHLSGVVLRYHLEENHNLTISPFGALMVPDIAKKTKAKLMGDPHE